MTKLIGCDPGQTGAFCALDSTMPSTPEFLDMPVLTRTVATGKKRKQIDLHQVRDWLQSIAKPDSAHVFIEEINGFGSALGHTAGSFPFARDYGGLLDYWWPCGCHTR